MLDIGDGEEGEGLARLEGGDVGSVGARSRVG